MLSKRLRALRKQQNMTMKEFGAKFGLAESTISGYENGHRSPDYETLQKFAQFFECSVDFLLGNLRTEIFEGQKSESSHDESLSELSDNKGTMNIRSGTGWDSGQKAINLAPKQIKNEDVSMVDVDIIRIPVLGTIKAGYDLYAEQQVIGLEPVAKQVVSDGAEYFFLVVKGDSMIEEGIREGMKVLVRRQEWVDDGKIGVVILNGDEATLKRVLRRENEIVLISSNAKYPPRIVPISEARIQGQVKQVVWDV